MRRRVCSALVGASTLVLTASVCLVALTAQQPAPEQPAPEQPAPSPVPAAPAAAAVLSPQQLTLNRYCIGCHNQRAKTAGLALDTLDLGHVGEHPEIWEKVVQKLNGKLMPPGGRPRPDEATYAKLTSYLEASLDEAAIANANPGRTEALHRLNRAEYRNAVRDLLAVDIDVSSMLPADDISYGFDNIAGVQRMSPTLMERYIAAAEKISTVAVGASALPPTTDNFIVPPELRQDDRLDTLPFGTRGGTAVHYTFPRDGIYNVRVQLTRNAGASFDDIPSFYSPQRLELSVDDTPIHVFELPAEPAKGAGPVAVQGTARRALDSDWQVRFEAKAGPRTVALTFLNRTPALLENLLEPFEKPVPGGSNGYYTTQKGAYLHSVAISGPYEDNGPGQTPSRERIFICRPAGVGEETRCATKILSALARRAFRRPVQDADLETLLAFYQEGRSGASFEAGIERAVEGLLVSPEFLYRIEREPAAASGSIYRISDVELASRLSFFLWSSIPDDALLEAASDGTLHTPGVLDRQVRRMLADPRAEALVNNFVGQWLFLRNLPTILPDPRKDPDFDEGLRQGFRRETELFTGSVIREDRSLLDLLNANYTFVNERLARHYGIPNIYGTHFRRVEVTDDNRRGLLGQGSVLTITSFPNRTSPVVRGKWILENLLGSPLPPPPPDVPTLKEKPNAADEELSMRDRIAQHRASPVCAACHAMMDPLGLSLENYDFVGKWRTADEALISIDASGTLPDGTKFEGPAGLRKVLLDHPDHFVRTFTEKMLTYALGRGLEYYDMPAVRKIVRGAAGNDYRASAVILGIVDSLPFQMRRRES